MAYWSYFWLFLAPFTFGAFALVLQKRYDQSVKLFLAFSGAFLLVTCINHLLPELFEEGPDNAGAFILLGFFLQIIFEFISEGVEHGHVHSPKNEGMFPGLVFIGLCIHAFTEGLPLADIQQGGNSTALYWGILMHKLPIAVVLISLFAAHNVSRMKALLALALFSSLAPLGGAIGYEVNSIVGFDLLPYFLATTVGIILHISTVILLETSHNHRFNLLKFAFTFIGGLLAFFIF